MTGVSIDAGIELLGKRVQLLLEVAPKASKFAYLAPPMGWEGNYGNAMREIASRAGIALVGPPLNSPIDESEYRRVLAAMLQQGAPSSRDQRSCPHSCRGKRRCDVPRLARLGDDRWSASAGTGTAHCLTIRAAQTSMASMPMIDHGKRSDPPMRGPKKKKVRALRGESYAPSADTGVSSPLFRPREGAQDGTFKVQSASSLPKQLHGRLSHA